MLRRIAVLITPGLLVGLILFGSAMVVGAGGGDAGFGKHQLLLFSSMPLSLLAGDAVYQLKTATSSSMTWNAIDLVLVLLNWSLISLVIMSLVGLARRPAGGNYGS